MGRSTVRLAFILAVVTTAALALTFGAANASAKGCDRHMRQAVFVQTNDTSANSIMVYDRSWNGMLKFAGTYATGGMGGVAAGSVVDPLASQGSVASADNGQVLLTVNAGSDSLSLFRVACGDKLQLKQVVASGGQFPVSIAVRGHLVYALNAGVEGGMSSVQGFRLAGNHLWPIPGSNRSLGATSTSVPFFLASPGMVGFTPDGRHLIVTTKASGSMIDVFDVGPWGKLGSAPVMNASATPVPFAFSFDRRGRLVVVEAGLSTVSTYRINHDDTLTTIGSAPDGQRRGLLDQRRPRLLLRLQRRRGQHQYLRAGLDRHAQRDRLADRGRRRQHRLRGHARRPLPLPGVRRHRSAARLPHRSRRRPHPDPDGDGAADPVRGHRSELTALRLRRPARAAAA